LANKQRQIAGFHDVCLTLLLALNTEKASTVGRILVKRATFHNYLTGTLEETAMEELQYLYVLLYLFDHELEGRMRNAELGTLFALSWPLTWFSHSLRHYHQVPLDTFVICLRIRIMIYSSDSRLL
jgi:TBC1 domain family member 20